MQFEDDGDGDYSEEKYDYFQKVAQENGIEFSTWSIYEVTDFEKVPYPDATRFFYDNLAGDEPIEIEIHAGSSWLELWKAADKVIEKSGDLDHSFIEALELEGETVQLVTGS